jgi:hypothetical protein
MEWWSHENPILQHSNIPFREFSGCEFSKRSV